MKILGRCAALVLLFAGAAGWSEESVRLITSVDKVERFIGDGGERQKRLVATERVTRGDELQYSIAFANESDETVHAGSIVITTPLPNNTVYLADSAQGAGTEIVFSADDGESWGPPGSLMITAASGAAQRAEADDFTHIRWTLRSPLEPGGQGVVAFRVRLE